MNNKKLAILEKESIQRISMITGYSETVVRDILRAQTEFILDEIKCGTPVRLGNLGTFYVHTAEFNQGFNFRDKTAREGKKVVSVIKFKPSVALKKAAKENN